MYDTLAQWVEFQILKIYDIDLTLIYEFQDGGLYCVMDNILIVI